MQLKSGRKKIPSSQKKKTSENNFVQNKQHKSRIIRMETAHNRQERMYKCRNIQPLHTAHEIIREINKREKKERIQFVIFGCRVPT